MGTSNENNINQVILFDLTIINTKKLKTKKEMEYEGFLKF